MNRLRFLGIWNILSGKVRQGCARIARNDASFVAAREKELVGRLQTRLGRSDRKRTGYRIAA